MALLLPLLLPRIALILAAIVTMAIISYVAGLGWCAIAVSRRRPTSRCQWLVPPRVATARQDACSLVSVIALALILRLFLGKCTAIRGCLRHISDQHETACCPSWAAVCHRETSRSAQHNDGVRLSPVSARQRQVSAGPRISRCRGGAVPWWRRRGATALG